MKVSDARRMLEKAGGVKGIEEALGVPLSGFYHDCHNASLRIVRTGVFGPARVARGMASGMFSQHSWIVAGEADLLTGRPDPYDASAVIVDPTLWSYQGVKPYVHFGKNSMKTHVPHGSGSIWAHGHPENCDPAAAVELDWKEPPSKVAQAFIEALGPLDKRGWVELAHYPVQGGPSGEFITAIADTFGEVQVPVDILGMTTGRNPGGLYW